MNNKISATIITFNEEKNIKRCIESLDFCDEIIVVDSLSNDNTCAIATQLGAKVINQKFLGHIKQKQLAVDNCTNDWILSLDADEMI
jgi:glycosyltransferase involved in cell wall biosynthesis